MFALSDGTVGKNFFNESLTESFPCSVNFIIAAAAGLFVDPKKGPVLANYGLDNLRFTQPVYVGDTIGVKLTCKTKTKKENREGQIPQGVVEWDVVVSNLAFAIYDPSLWALALLSSQLDFGGQQT